MIHDGPTERTCRMKYMFFINPITLLFKKYY